MDGDGNVRKALALIVSVPLDPPEHKLLSCFVRDSVDPDAAARYVLRRASQSAGNGKDAEFELRHLLADWKQLVKRFTSPTRISATARLLVSARDSNSCCITKRSRDWWDMFGWNRAIPVSIIPDKVVEGLDDAAYASLREILRVFISEDQLRRLMGCVDPNSSDTNQVRNIWTLEQHVAAAFRNGRVQIQQEWDVAECSDNSMQATCQYILLMVMPRHFPIIMSKKGRPIYSDDDVIISTNDPQTMPLPSAFLFGLHSRFCNSLRWLQVQEQMQLAWPGNTIWNKCQKISRRMIQRTIPIFRRIWLNFPRVIRTFTYRLLLYMGLRIYGKQLGWVQRVPFGLYIKHGRGQIVPVGEAPALRLVEQYTDVPAPRLIELLTHENYTYLVMTRLPGVPLLEAIDFMSYPERTQLAVDLRNSIFKFRQIPNSNTTAICSANGGPVFDYRLPGKSKSAGPFPSEADFNKCLITQQRLRSATHERSHNIYFSHADLSLLNILVCAGKLSGLVDFGCAGFYPEYWEYTKGIFGHFGPDTAWIDLLTKSFSNSYLEELEAEQKLWEVVTPW